jgi:putative DNA methylase
MTWDFCEVNPFAEAAGDIGVTIRGITEVLDSAPAIGVIRQAEVIQRDAVRDVSPMKGSLVVVTDPPYYDNIGYADLSDFFYVWLRRSIGTQVWPDLFATMLTPKDGELIASPYRHGGDKEKARAFFEAGLRQAFGNMKANAVHEVPLTIFYAFKQSESDEGDDDGESEGASPSVASTGWETMLEGLLQAGCSVLGTWPMRTERRGRMLSIGTNALASSIALVCRPKDEAATFSSRRDLLADLKRELPDALRKLQASLIAPVDLAQAAIGPGMAIFSRYSKVLEENGTPMRVRTALTLINQVLDEVLAEHDGAYDVDTRWAIAWFEEHGFDEAAYGDGETLARAKNTSMAGLVEAGIVKSKGGKVRLLRRDELDPHWMPESDTRLTVWEVTHHLLSAHETGGDASAGRLVMRVGEHADAARDLAYRLYTVCERNKWSQAGQDYNALVVGWSDIIRATSIDASGVLPLVDMAPSGPSLKKAKRLSVAEAAPAASGARRR